MLNFVKVYKLLNELFRGGDYIFSYINTTPRLTFVHRPSHITLECICDGVLVEGFDSGVDFFTTIPDSLPIGNMEDVRIVFNKDTVKICSTSIPAVFNSANFPYNSLTATKLIEDSIMPLKYKRWLDHNVYKELMRQLRSPKVNNIKLKISKGIANFQSVYTSNLLTIHSESQVEATDDGDDAIIDITRGIADRLYKLLSLFRVPMLSPQCYHTNILQYGGHTSLMLRKNGGGGISLLKLSFLSGSVETLETESYRDIKNLKYLFKVNNPDNFVTRLSKFENLLEDRESTLWIKTGNSYAIENKNYDISDNYISGFHANTAGLNDEKGLSMDIAYAGLLAYTNLYPKSESVQINAAKDIEKTIYVLNEAGKDNYIFIDVNHI